MKRIRIWGIWLCLLCVSLAWPEQLHGQCTVPAFGKPVTIHNPNPTSLTNYVVKVQVDTDALQTAGKLSNPMGFVFLGTDCGTQLAYWPSEADPFPSPSAAYYVLVPSIPASDSIRISINYDNVTVCPQVITNVFSSIGNATPLTAPVGFAAATTWEVSNYTFPVDATTYRWDVQSDNSGTMRPKTTYTVSSTQFVRAEGTTMPIIAGQNSFVDEIVADNGGHPGFYSGATQLRIGENCGLCNTYGQATGDLPPNSAPLASTVANDARIEVWYRPRAGLEPTTAVGGEFDRNAMLVLSPSNPGACRGDSVTFTASIGFTNYKWYFDGVLVSTGAASTETFPTTGLPAGSYPVRVDGFFSSCDSTTTSTALTVHPSPAIDSLLPDSVCEGEPFTATAGITVDGANITTYSWDFGDGNTATGATPSYTYTSSGALNLELAILTDLGCVDTLVEPITVHSKPQISSIDETNVCWPEVVEFTNVSSIPGNWANATITSYDWRFGNGNSGSGDTATQAFAIAAQYSDTLIVTTNYGCSDSLEGSVDVWPKPDILSVTDPDVCWPQAVSFSNNTNIPNNWNAASVTTFDWHFGDGTTGSGTSTTHGYTTPARYNDSLIVVTNNGCRDTLAETLDIWPKPQIDSVTAPDICWPQAVAYQAFQQISNNWNSTTITSESWDFGDSNTSNVNPVNHSYVTANAYNYRYINTTGDGCTDTLDATVNIWPKPDISALFETDTCWPDTALFWNSTTIPMNWNNATVADWDWRLGDGAMASDSATAHYYAVPNQYNDTLFVTTTDACLDTLTGTVNIWPKPVIDSIVTADACEPNAIDFSAATSIPDNWNSATISTYVWDFGDGNFGTGMTTSHLYATYGTYMVTLVVTTSNNCTDTLTTTVTYSPKPSAIFGLSDVCFGDTLQFTDSSTIANGDTLLYFWSFGDGNTSNAQAPAYSYSSAGTYAVTQVVTSGAGCRDTLIQTLDVHPKPNAEFSFPRTCEPEPVAFTDASTVSSGVISTYAWDFGDGNNAAAQNPQHSYAVADTYTVQLIVTTNYACLDTATHVLVLNPKPQADFYFENVCWPSAMELRDTSTLQAGNITAWDWNLGNGDSASSASFFYTYANPGTYNVTLVVTTDSLCSDTVTQSVASNHKPVAAMGPASVCLPDTAQFTDLSTIPLGSLTAWTWDFGDGDGDTLQNPYHLYEEEGTYPLEFIVFSDSGCTDTVNLNFEAFPLPGLELGSDTMWLCPWNTVTLNASEVFAAHLWDDASTDSLRTVDVAGTYWVTVTDTNGCTEADTVIVPLAPQPDLVLTPGDTVGLCAGSTVVLDATTPDVLAYEWEGLSTDGTYEVNAGGDYTAIGWNVYACSDTVVVNVMELALPVLDLGTDQIICGWDSVTLGAAGNFVGYSWSNGATDSALTVRGSGDFVLIVTDANGCSNSDTVRVNRYNLPVLNLGPDSSLCSGDSIVLDGGNFDSYQWSTGATTPTILTGDAGTYFVQVTDENGCTNMSSMITLTVDPQPDVPAISKEKGDPPMTSTPEDNWQWFLEGQPIAGATDQQYIPQETGNYTVMVTNTEGCKELSEPFFIQLEIYEEEMYEGISPNNDGINDFLVVPAVEYYPENEIVIYSRWGNEVYRRRGYVNNFHGLSNNGDALPDGTYYYILDLGDGQSPIKGFFVIHR